MNPPSMLQQLYALAMAQHWLPLIAILALWVRKLASPQSGFPINIPTTWLPTVSATGGLVYGLVSSLQGGESASASIFDMVAAAAGTGFVDGLTSAIFAHNSAPAWARALVGIFDDVGSSGGKTVQAVSDSHAASTAFGVRAAVAPASHRILVVHLPRAFDLSRVRTSLLSFGLLVALCFAVSCQAALAAIPGIISIADAECTQAKADPSTPAWVDFICTVAHPKPGEAAQFTYRVAADQAASFATAHAPKANPY